jgi:hypothetical protein
MDEFRIWWANVIRGLLAWLAAVWGRFTYGLMHEWDVMWFILVLGVILIVSLGFMWRRRT